MDVTIPVFREAPHACPYLQERACSNLRFILSQGDRAFVDLLLERGFRHFGDNFFRPECPDCKACVGIRIPVNDFKPDRSQRRCLRDNADLTFASGPIVVDEERLELLNRFQVARWIDKNWGLIEYDEGQYLSSFFWNAEVSQEITVRDKDGHLLAVGIVDFTDRSMSATYHYHDPLRAKRGLGTWLILKELELLNELHMEYLYMGLWNNECKSLQYKNHFRPHEMFTNGEWKAS